MSNRVVHFEIEATDKERAKEFYKKAFDWQMDQMGQDMGGYIVVKTGDPKEPGGINGGIFEVKDKKELNAYSCVISVEDADKSMADVKAAGGKVLSEKMDILGVGLYVKCEDTEGNKFTILQASSDMTQR